jgi:hypothetical protein
MDDYNYALGGTAYTAGGYKPTDASGPLIQPSLDGVSFQEKCATPALRYTCSALQLLARSDISSLQRRPRIHGREDHECAVPRVTRHHHCGSAGHKRGHAILPAPALERVSRAAADAPKVQRRHRLRAELAFGPVSLLSMRRTIGRTFSAGRVSPVACRYGDALRSLSSTVAGYGQFFSGQFPSQCRWRMRAEACSVCADSAAVSAAARASSENARTSRPRARCRF